MKTKTKKKGLSLGTGLSAKCVVTPALKCKTSKNQKLNLTKMVSKVIETPEKEIMKEILEREIFTSTLIKSNQGDPLSNRFITIDTICNLDLSVNKNREKFIKENCGIDRNDSSYSYQIFNMYNGACTKNTKKSQICGNLSNPETCKYLAKSTNLKKLVRYLLEAVEFLHNMDVVHCDIKPLNILCDDKGVVRFIDYGSSIFLKDSNKGQREFETMCQDLTKIIKTKSSIFNSRDQFYNKVAAITVKFTPPEIGIARCVLKKEDMEFSEMYLEMILNYMNRDTKDFKKLIKRYHRNGYKIIRDLFCKKNPMIYKWDVFSLGKTFAEIYFVGKNKENHEDIPDELRDLIDKMTHSDYKKRISIKDALSHPYLN